MNDSTTPAWDLYESGLDYNRKINLYETNRQNEKFYRGEQWDGYDRDLPRPVFNVTRRIVDFLVGAVSPQNVSIRYSDEKLPYLDSSALRNKISESLSLLEQNALWRWKTGHMNDVAGRALLNAAISGDGVFYCWWDSALGSGQPFTGEIRTDVVDGANLFLCDVNNPDIQSQDYIILSGRAPAVDLRREAIAAGVAEEEAEKILPDDGDLSIPERKGSEKATYLIRFFREDGKVIFEKSTRSCVIRRSETGLNYYPVVLFNWFLRKGSYHGSSPITELIPNQKYVNSAYALVMKHMSDTAFSKVVYDKSRIPEWSNEVGEAIATVGGGNVADAVSVLGTGKLEAGYLDLINNALNNTKNLMGATDAALGDEKANNTSAILALRESSMISLRQVAARFARALGEVATIWADMLCAFCPSERLLPVEEEGGVATHRLDYQLLAGELLRACVTSTDSSTFTLSASVSLLTNLLSEGHITPRQYLQAMPDGCLPNRTALLQELSAKGGEVNLE